MNSLRIIWSIIIIKENVDMIFPNTGARLRKTRLKLATTPNIKNPHIQISKIPKLSNIMNLIELPHKASLLPAHRRPQPKPSYKVTFVSSNLHPSIFRKSKSSIFRKSKSSN